MLGNPRRVRRRWRAPSASALAREEQLRRLAALIEAMQLTEQLDALEQAMSGATKH